MKIKVRWAKIDVQIDKDIKIESWGDGEIDSQTDGDRRKAHQDLGQDIRQGNFRASCWCAAGSWRAITWAESCQP